MRFATKRKTQLLNTHLTAPTSPRNRTARHAIRWLALLLVGWLALNADALAQQYIWTGLGDGTTWTNNANWSPNTGHPSALGDNAVFDASSPSATLTNIPNPYPGNLTLQSGFTGTVTIDANYSSNGAVTVSGGTLVVQDGFDFAAGTCIINGGTLTLNTPGGNHNLGTFSLQDGTFNYVGGAGGSINLSTFTQSGGTFNGGSAIYDLSTFTQSGGTFNGGSATYELSSNFTKNGGTFNAGTSKFIFTAEATALSNTDITFYQLEHIGGTLTLQGSGGTRIFTIQNSLTRGASATGGPSGFELFSATLSYAPNASLVYNYSGNRSVDPDEWPTTNGPTNVIHNGSGSVTLPFARTIPDGGKLELDATANFNASSVITIQGELIRKRAGHTIAGTEPPQYSNSTSHTSRLVYDFSSGTATIGNEWPSSNPPRNVTVKVSGATVQVTSSTTRTVLNDFIIESGTIGGSSATNTLTVNVGGTVGVGTLNTGGTFTNGTIVMVGSGNQSIIGGSGTNTVSNLTINKASASDEVSVVGGILKIASGGTLRVQQGILQLGGTSTNVLDISGATLRIDNGATFRTGGKTITTSGSTTYQLEDGSIFEYNGTGGTETALSIDANGSSNMTPANSYSILRVSNSINIPSGDLDVRTELRFNTSVNAVVNSGGSNGLIRLGLGATITGDNSPTTRFVNGPLRRFFNGSNLSGTFAVGKTGGANDVTIQFNNLGSELALTIEQFNANPTGTVSGGILSASRYWQFLDPSRALSGEAYNLTVEIAGSGIPSPLNRVVLLQTGSFGSNPVFNVPVGTQTDNGTTVAVTGFPYTTLAQGGTPGFTLAQIGGKVWDGGASTTSWFDANNWDPDGVPSATDNVIIGTPSLPSPTVVIGAASAVANTLNLGGLAAGSPVLQINHPDAIDFDNVNPGSQWDATKTTFGSTATVEYLQGNVRSDQYANLTVGGTGTIGTDGGAITVNSNFTKSGSSTFSPTHDISVAGNFSISGGTFNAGSQTYTITGNFTLSGATLSAGTSTFNFNASGIQQLTGNTTFWNLTKSNGGTLSLQSSTDVTVGGQLNLAAGSVFSINANNTLTLNGTITGSGLLSGTPTSNLVIGGTSGGSVGTIAFQVGNRDVGNFTMNRTGSGAAATMGSPLTVNNTLTMTNGILNTTTTNLITAATTSGGSTTSFVNGPLAITGTGTQVYPIGKGTIFRPVEVQGKQSGTLRIEVFNAPAGNAGAVNPNNPRVSNERYWTVSVLSGSPIDASTTVALTYNNAENDGVTVPATVQVATGTATPPAAIGAWTPRGNTATPTVLGVNAIRSGANLPTSGTVFYTFYTTAPLPDNPLPVELISFVGTSSRAGVVLNWATASERESAGFIIHRRILSAGQTEWQMLDDYTRNPALVAKNSTNGAQYAYTDRSDLPAGAIVEYRLDEVSLNGTIERLREVRVETRFSTIVSDFALEQNYPNPFNPTTNIPYQLKERSKVTLEIYNALGQKVATLVDAVQERGNYAPTFNASGLASGMYFYRLTAQGSRETFVQTKKMMLVK